MKTKEEIIQDNEFFGLLDHEGQTWPAWPENEVAKMMQEFADQEKQALKEKIKLICQEARMDDRISALTAKLIIDQF